MTTAQSLPDTGSPVVDIEATRRRLTARQAEAVANLVRAAEEETEEVGYAGLTVRGVARRASVAPATAYTYFSSKDHLLAEVLWRRMEALPPVETDQSVPVATRVARTVRDMIPFAAQSPALIDACTVALISPSPDVSHLRDRIGAQTHRRLVAALGLIRPPASPERWPAHHQRRSKPLTRAGRPSRRPLAKRLSLSLFHLRGYGFSHSRLDRRRASAHFDDERPCCAD